MKFAALLLELRKPEVEAEVEQNDVLTLINRPSAIRGSAFSTEQTTMSITTAASAPALRRLVTRARRTAGIMCFMRQA